jgi:hypothetical protein
MTIINLCKNLFKREQPEWWCPFLEGARARHLSFAGVAE